MIEEHEVRKKGKKKSFTIKQKERKRDAYIQTYC